MSIGTSAVAEALHHEVPMIPQRGNVAMAPSSVDQRLVKALSLAQQGRAAEAIAQLRPALAKAPRHPRLRNTLGVLQLEQGDARSAIETLTPLLTLLPKDAGARLNLANALVANGQWDEALLLLEQAVALEPRSADVHYAYGRALQFAGRPADAAAAYHEVLLHQPKHLAARSSLAAAYGFLDRPQDAERESRLVLAAAPGDAGTHLNLGVALLAQGLWADGWAEYEWRWHTDAFAPIRRPWAAPLWNAESLNGCTLLVHAEQGLGDTLHFVRYLPELRAMGARVVLECQAPLVTLVQHAALADEVLATGDPLPPHDYHLPLLSVTHRLGAGHLRPLTPTRGAYLAPHVPPASRRLHAPRRVGLVWAGSPTHLNDRHRSCGLPALMPLFDLPDVEWISVQTGPRRRDLAALDLAHVIQDAGASLPDFAATAAVVSTLDLVVTVDSAVAHLAGSLGVPTCVLLPRIGLDWRWNGDEARSTWYESLMMHRQGTDGTWTAAVAGVALCIAQIPATRHG